MKMTCEWCGREWDTTGDVHGIEVCRAGMRAELAEAGARAERADSDWKACLKALAAADAEVARLRRELDEANRTIAAHAAEWRLP